jgi:hypothetical protein
VGVCQHPRNPPCITISQPQLFPQIPSCTDISFSHMFVLQNYIVNTLHIDMCLCCLPVRGESRILACPLSTDNLYARRQTAFLSISFVNVSHCLILTTQELYNSTLLLTNMKRSSHFEGAVWQRYAWQKIELNLNRSGKDSSMYPTKSRTVQ